MTREVGGIVGQERHEGGETTHLGLRTNRTREQGEKWCGFEYRSRIKMVLSWVKWRV